MLEKTPSAMKPNGFHFRMTALLVIVSAIVAIAYRRNNLKVEFISQQVQIRMEANDK